MTVADTLVVSRTERARRVLRQQPMETHMPRHTLARYPMIIAPTAQRIASILLASLLNAGAAMPAAAADIIVIVTSTGDLGGSCPGASCTLRAAIDYANASPALDQIIGFNISGACPQTIKIFSALPTIGDSLSIRGYTQPGATPNTLQAGDNATLCIQLQPVSTGSGIANGLRFAPSDIADTFDVSGLSIGGFDDAIRIEGGNSTVSGNFRGVDADGTSARTNGYDGVLVMASNAYFATTRVVGGTEDADRNLISGNGTGVNLASGGGNVVRNNFIGTTRSGNAPLPNVNGIYASSLSNDIEGNVVSGNSSTAIRLEGANGAANVVGNNRIGIKALAFCVPQPCVPDDALGNGGDGVRIANGATGTNVSTNTIAWNDGDGISLPDAGPQNGISANAMHDNGGLGIDLGADGVDTNDNDAAAPAGAPNRLLNYPVISSVGGSDDSGIAHGTLQSTNGHYMIEFYADTVPDPSQHGEGRVYLGYGEGDITNATAGADGSVSFDLPITGGVLVGQHISAIARDAIGNTSEFSLGQTYLLSDVIFANGFESLSP
jgi:CSLREA domain-containing protein